MRLFRYATPVLAALMLCTLAVADEPIQARIAFNIPQQPLSDALTEWSRQSGLQVLHRERDSSAAEMNSAEVLGEFSPAEALGRMLSKTGLQYEFVNDNTVRIAPTSAARDRNAAPVTGVEASAWESRMAQTESPQRGIENGAGQTSGASSEDSLEEVVVTAQKREERLQDVPISISVLGGDELDRSTATGVTEALSRVPGVGINETYQGGGTQVAVRGVTAGGALFNGSSPVSYYLDSVPFGLVRQAIGPDTNAYDLERVEVLRGPQGTLYGASAQNGVVRILTKDADPDEFEFKARTSASSTDGGGENYRGDLAVNVPLVEGKLAARAVLGYQDMSGWIDRLNKQDVNDAEISNMRLKINAQPTEQLSIGASVWLSRSDFGGPSISDDNLIRVATLDEVITTDFDAYGLKIGYDFPAVSVASMTSYLEYTNDGYLDLGTIVPGLLDQTKLTSDVFSQEVVLNSELAGPWRWSLGGMYRDAEDLQYQVSRLDGAMFPPDNDQIYISQSFAVFGELARKFLDGRVELSGGLRYFEDDVTSDDRFRGVQGDESFDALSPRVVLTWHAREELTAYASYAEGFRSGFPQSGFLQSVAPQFPPLDSDTLRNYELGAKGNLWNDRLSFDTALYFIDWQDVQQSLTVPVTATAVATALINSESASGVGFDIGVTTRPIDGLQLGVNFSWNDLTMDADVLSGSVLLFEKGERLNISPEYTVGTSAEYAFPIGGGGLKGRLSASANYTSEMDTRTIVSGEQSIAFGDAILMARAGFAIVAPEHWTATLFVDNLGNEQGSPLRFPIFREFLPWDTRVRPRTIGVQLEYQF